MNTHEKTYIYKPNRLIFLFCALFFGAATWVLVGNAMENEAGSVIGDIIHLNKTQTTWGLWLLTACAGAFSLIGVVALFTPGRKIILMEDGIKMPRHPLFGRIVKIPYDEITSMEIIRVSGQSFLNIYYREPVSNRDCKTHIPATMVKNKRTLEKIARDIHLRLPEERR